MAQRRLTRRRSDHGFCGDGMLSTSCCQVAGRMPMGLWRLSLAGSVQLGISLVLTHPRACARPTRTATLLTFVYQSSWDARGAVRWEHRNSKTCPGDSCDGSFSRPS